jgi:hypothetical protein
LRESAPASCPMDWGHWVTTALKSTPTLKDIVSVGGGLVGASSGAWHFWADYKKKRDIDLRRLVIKLRFPHPPLTDVIFVFEASEVHEGLRIDVAIRSPPDLRIISEADAYVGDDGFGSQSVRPDIASAGERTIAGVMRYSHRFTQSRTIKSDHPEFSAKFVHPSDAWIGEVVVTITSVSTGRRLLRRTAKISPTT